MDSPLQFTPVDQSVFDRAQVDTPADRPRSACRRPAVFAASSDFRIFAARGARAASRARSTAHLQASDSVTPASNRPCAAIPVKPIFPAVPFCQPKTAGFYTSVSNW